MLHQGLASVTEFVLMNNCILAMAQVWIFCCVENGLSLELD